MERHEEHRRQEPDLAIFSPDFYWLMLTFLATWCVATLLGRCRSRVSLFGLSRKVCSSIFTCTTAHVGVMNDESPSRLLQLALVASVSLVLAIWGASFSNQNVRVDSPNVYTSYKSLADDPPDHVLIDAIDRDSRPPVRSRTW